MLADLARQLGGDDVVVYSIVSPGGDPHLYQPTPRDARQLSRSQLVITSGLGLEGWIDDLVRHAGGQRPIVVASTGVTPIGDPGGDGVDPHFWFDLRAWETAVDNVAAALGAMLDGSDSPAGATSETGAAGTTTGTATSARARLEQRVRDYRAANAALHDWTAAAIASIPEPRRVLVTSHDAFSYFSRAYDIEVLSLIGTSTDQEAGQRDVANLISTVRARGIPAVFVESSVNPRTLEQVARETGARYGGVLYVDSLSGPDGPVPTYLDLLKVTAQTIAEGLSQ